MFAGIGVIGALASIMASLLVSPAEPAPEAKVAPATGTIDGELAETRTELQQTRTELSQTRTEIAELRTLLADGGAKTQRAADQGG